MTFVHFLIVHVFPNLFQVFAIILGITAASVSAGIEYIVFNRLFTSVDSLGVSSPVYMALLCVLCLEGTKIYLHIFIPIWENRDKATGTGKIISAKVASGVKWALVAMSIVCTIMFSINLLYSDVVTTDKNTKEQRIQEIDIKYDLQVNKLQEQQEQAEQQSLEIYKTAYEDAKAQYDEYTQRVYTMPVTTDERTRLHTRMDEALSAWQDAQISVPKQLEEEYTPKYQKIENNRRNELSALDNQGSFFEGSNQLIHVTLMSIAHYMFSKQNYSMKSYFLTSVGFAVSLAIVLELIISINLKPLALTKEQMEAFLPTDHLNDTEKNWLRNIVRAFVAATISLIAYLIFCMFWESGVGLNVTAGALLIFAASNLLAQFASPKPDIKKGTGWKEKARTGAKSFHYWFTSLAAKACLAFAGYVFLGFLFGIEFKELTLPAVGMTVGSAAGHIIHLPDSV